MKPVFSGICLAFVCCFSACKVAQNSVAKKDDGKIEVVFVEVNDVYEIAPLSGGWEGGMARVATLKKQQQQLNKNTFLVMAGDFVSPSVFNSLQYEGKAIRGKQMVAAMNAAGMDFAVFGNHEFDIKEGELQDRLNESQFNWIATNTFHKKGTEIKPFSKKTAPVPKWHIQTVTDADGTTARIAIIGLTLPSNPAEYVHYTDAFDEAKKAYALLKDSADAVVALTHQTLAEDVRLAKEVPGLALILGGHEHDQRFEKVGNVYITKAHSNARSAYVVKMDLKPKKKKVSISPSLHYLNESIAIDSTTDAVVQQWITIADKAFRQSGFDARKVVLENGLPLEGRETETRHRSTNLTQLVISAMETAVPTADVALFNAGSIRVDDVLNPPISQYDIIRAMPFGGGIREVDMRGSLLQKVLTAGRNNRGNGGFLQYSATVNYYQASRRWFWKESVIDENKIYHVALPEFLLSGKETNLQFLNEKNEDIVKVYPAETTVGTAKSDIRLAIIQHLQK